MAVSRGTVPNPFNDDPFNDDPFNQDSLNRDPSRPAQQRREGIKVPDILAAEFSPLTLLSCAAVVVGHGIAPR